MELKFLQRFEKKKVRIIINGGGGSNYSDEEVSEFRKFLKKIKPYAFVSRDEHSFENYNDLAEYSLNGIGCAFFIDDYFTPAKLELPKYVIVNFDNHPEPELKQLSVPNLQVLPATIQCLVLDSSY